MDCKIDAVEERETPMLLIELDAKEYKGDGEESMAASTIRVFWDRPGEMGAGLVRTKGGKIISVKCRK